MSDNPELRLTIENAVKVLGVIAAIFAAYWTLDSRITAVQSRATLNETAIVNLAKSLDEIKEDRRRDNQTLNDKFDKLTDKIDKLSEKINKALVESRK